MPDVTFNIVTGLLKAFEDGDGIKRLKTTASSTVLDLGGDEMGFSALQRMAATAQQNMTIFLNHKYQVPEDVLGSVQSAEILSASDTPGIYDLDFDIRVDEANERAVKAWKQIQNGTKLGCSIGARIPEGGYEKTKTGLKIKDIHLQEASIVGIPANPRSFVHYALKALHDAEREEEETVVTETATTTNINLSLEGPATATVGEAGAETITIIREDKPDQRRGPLTSEDVPGLAEEIADAEVVDETGEPDEAPAETTPTESEATGDSPAEGDSGSDEPSQEAVNSVPESDGIDDEDTRAVIAKGIETLQSLLQASNEELVESRKALAGETDARVRAERERDEARSDLKLARDIVERVAALPIGRRTSFKAAASEFRTRFSGVYDDETLQLMERDSSNGK